MSERARPEKARDLNQGAKLLSAWRNEQGLTLDDAAEKIGCDRYMLNRYENGVHIPQGKRVILFKDLCKIPVESWYL